MNPFPEDIFTAPGDVDRDALANLRSWRFAGVWQGANGVDFTSKAAEPEPRPTKES